MFALASFLARTTQWPLAHTGALSQEVQLAERQQKRDLSYHAQSLPLTPLLVQLRSFLRGLLLEYKAGLVPGDQIKPHG